MKVSVNENIESVSASAMKIRDIAQIVSGAYRGQCIMRTYSGFVVLDDPSTTFSVSAPMTFTVRILPPGTTVTLTVE